MCRLEGRVERDFADFEDSTYARCTVGVPGREFARSTIPRLKVEYQPKRELFFRAIGEYRSDRTAALVDPASGAPLYDRGRGAAGERVVPPPAGERRVLRQAGIPGAALT